MENLSLENILKEELTKRMGRNPSYSLRSFSKDLGIDASQLSRVISGKRKMNYLTAKKVSVNLYKTKIDRDYFCAVAEWEVTKKESEKDKVLEKLLKLQEGQTQRSSNFLEDVKVLGHWYHIAILDLLEVQDIKNDDEGYVTISKVFGIKKIQAQVAIQLLLKVGLIKDKKYLKRTHKILFTSHGIPSKTIQKFHKQMIEKSLQAIDEQSVHERMVTGKTFGLNQNLIPELKKLTDDYNQKVSDLIQSEENQKKNSVYQLNIQLFNLIKKEKK